MLLMCVWAVRAESVKADTVDLLQRDKTSKRKLKDQTVLFFVAGVSEQRNELWAK